MTIQAGVILSKRALESTVVVDDTQIIVLGGLIEDRLTDGSDKVPLFGDIPLAGALFRYDARRRQKTNLMIFIKPTVLRTSADGREITSERYQYLMGEQERQTPPNRIFWGDPGQPALPPQGVSPGTPGRRPDAAAARADQTACAPAAPPPRRPGRTRQALTAPRRSRWPRSRPAPPPDSRTAFPMRSRATHGVLAHGGGARRDRRADAAGRHRRGPRRAEARAAAAAPHARRRRRALRRRARARLQRRGRRGADERGSRRARAISRG